MREIKFRAWNQDGQEFQFFVFGENGHFTYTFETYSQNALRDLQQYTGLKDKNSREIFQGDIVRANHPEDEENMRDELAIVVYEAPSFHAKYARDELNKFISGGNGFILRPQNEVIGNIYENPELLQPSVEGEQS